MGAGFARGPPGTGRGPAAVRPLPGGVNTVSARKNILLVSPPWRLASWPSLAIAALKSALTAAGIEAHAAHLHLPFALAFGPDDYGRIAQGWETGEALFFALAYPEQASAILARSADAIARRGECAALCGAESLEAARRAIDGCLATLNLDRYAVIGLSVGALQLGASIYLARRLRRSHPHLRIICGGSSLVGQAGAALLAQIPEVDLVVDGEGEEALVRVMQAPDWSAATLAAIPNVRCRDPDDGAGPARRRDVYGLATLPPPDFDEYFALLHSEGVPSLDVVYPIEASRGCAWEHRRGDGQLRGCTFCGLYRGSNGYRDKPFARIAEEVNRASDRYATLELSLTDAYLPSVHALPLLDHIAAHPADFTLFCELRCDLDRKTVLALARAGARQVQLGVEALDTGLLRHMVKGTRMIDNVQSIKLCAAYGVPAQYNLITHFPGATVAQIERTLALLPDLFGLPAPTLAHFYLDRGSRIFRDPEAHGLAAGRIDAEKLPFLPAELGNDLCQVVPIAPDDAGDHAGHWARLEVLVGQWRALEGARHAAGRTHGLSFRDTGRTLAVLDARQAEPVTLSLGGALRAILLACETIVPRHRLQSLFPDDPARLDEALAVLRAHRLIVEEKDLVLALPVAAPLPSGVQPAMIGAQPMAAA